MIGIRSLMRRPPLHLEPLELGHPQSSSTQPGSSGSQAVTNSVGEANVSTRWPKLFEEPFDGSAERGIVVNNEDCRRSYLA